MDPRPAVSLCMIVRDNSRTLAACLASVAPWVDEMIVVDTGSKDDTREIARRAGALVYEFPWCDDFSAARNESLQRATGEWLFWMDSDDTISAECGRQLRALAVPPSESAPTAYVMQVHCPGPPGSTDVTVVDQVKMFRNDPRLRFEGRIHEQILPAVRRIGGEIRWTDVYVTHSGSEHTPEARKRKQQRDLRLLELERADHPDHPFVLFNLGMTYADMEQPQRAVEFLQQCLTVSAPQESHVRKAYALLAGCLQQLERYDQCRDLLRQGLQLYDGDAELLFRLGVLEQKLANYEAAVAAYEGALEDQGERRFSSRDRGITGYKARHNLAGVYRNIHRPDLAELQWRLALGEEASFRSGWQGLVDVLLEQRKFVALEVEIELASKTGHLPALEFALAKSRLAAARGDVQSAVSLLDAAIPHLNGEAVEAQRLKCQLLFEQGAEEAPQALAELSQMAPEDGAVWHNLGTACQRAGRHQEAIAHYQRSVSLRPDAAHTWVQLGHAQREAGDLAAARDSWNRAKLIAPNHPVVHSVAGL
jgi:tetratricopeptide (TPR) repeat protein